MADKELKFKSIPRGAQIYYSVVSLAGVALLVRIMWSSLPLDKNRFGFLLFLSLAVLAEAYPMFDLGAERLGAGFVVYFASILVLGPYLASIIAALSVIPYRVLSRKPLHRTIFNISEVVIATFGAGLFYQYWRPSPSYYQELIPQVPILLACVLYFCGVDILLRSFGAALRETRTLTKRWKEGMVPMALYYVAIAPLGLLLAILFRQRSIAIAVFAVSMVTIYGYVGYQASVRRAKELAATDDLTGLFSRESFNERFELVLERAESKNFPVSLIYIILDNLDVCKSSDKELALMGLGEAISRCVRESDVPARDREDFLIGLPGAPKSGAKIVAEKIRSAIEGAKLGTAGAPITALIGIATFPEDASKPLELLQNSSKAAHRAKQKRDGIVSFEKET